MDKQRKIWTSLRIYAAMLGIYAVLILSVYFLEILPAAWMGFQMPIITDVLLSLLIGLAFGVIIFISADVMLKKAPTLQNPSVQALVNQVSNPNSLFKVALPFLLIAPILEEVLFRGVVLGIVGPHSKAIALILSALLFFAVRILNPVFKLAKSVLGEVLVSLGLLIFAFALPMVYGYFVYGYFSSIVNSIVMNLGASLLFTWLVLNKTLTGVQVQREIHAKTAAGSS